VAAVPTAPDLSDGLLLTSMLNDYVLELANFLRSPPAAMMRQTVAQSIVTATFTSLTMDTEEYDVFPSGGAKGHSTSVNTSRYTAVHPGYYNAVGVTSWAFNGTGARGGRWTLNGVALNASVCLVQAVSATQGTGVTIVGVRPYLSVGDYLELQGFQASGGNLNTGVPAGSQSGWSIQFAGA